MKDVARALQLLTCCAILTSCSRGSSPLPAAVSNGGAPQLAAPHASAVFQTLYHFKGSPDGSGPEAALTVMNGKLYGITSGGGKSYYGEECAEGFSPCGTIFEVSTSGTERVVYRFKGSPDGSSPSTSLLALNGNLYGSAIFDGLQQLAGVIFVVSPSGEERVLHAGSSGALTTLNGKIYGSGCCGKYGAVFELSRSGSMRAIYRFKGKRDGSDPGGLTAVSGKLYGVTEDDGLGPHRVGLGTIFELSTSGVEKKLYSFKGAPDGAGPAGSLTAVDGNLYGATEDGGSGPGFTLGCGTIFEVTGTGQERLLYNFKGSPDGEGPTGSLVALNGKLYGTTGHGGASGQGTVFEMSTSGAERVLYSFTGKSDGGGPSPLVALNGKLYGTASYGGVKDNGTIFEVTP